MKKKNYILIMFFIILFVIIFINISKDKFTSKVIDYNRSNLRISIDGVTSTTLPTTGNYYLVDYTCKSSDTVITWNNETHQLDVSNKNERSGVSCYLDFQSHPKLADMSVGSYVAYIGNNGCEGESCSGQNANYVDDTDMGYCFNEFYGFIMNGWRIVYKKGGSAYLVSAGAPECMCSASDGTSSSSSCSSYVSADNLQMHLDNMEDIARKYCNSDYSKDGICDKTTTWAMNAIDFENITGKTLSLSCYSKYGDKTCGYTNDLIDIGEHYWYATAFRLESEDAFVWAADGRSIQNIMSDMVLGVRPIIYLDSSVEVVGGIGTYEDPYQITNNSFRINDGAEYVGADGKSSVEFTLVGQNVSTMCINTNSSGCSNYVDFANTYTLDWSDEEDGEKVVYVYYKDANGNLIASMTRSIILDTIGPTNNSIVIGDGAGLTRMLTLFSSGASKMCISNTSSDVSSCTDWIDYTTSYKWRLSEGTGSKTVYAFYKDEAGNVSTATATVNVTSISEFIVNEYFDDTTYDSNITVTDGATYPWSVVNGRFESTNQTVDSSTSSSTIQFTPTVNATMSFDYGISSEAGCDKLTISLVESNSSSSTLVNAISGVNSGTKSNVSLTAGVTYTLTVKYVKDSGIDSNEDLAWIDNLIIDSFSG